MKSKKGEHTSNYERPMSTERTPSNEMQSGTEMQPNIENPSSIGLQSSYEVPRHKSVYEPKENLNIVALLAVAVSIISVFLPWFEYSTSAKSDTFNVDMESALNISGKSLDYPILGVFIILIGGFLAYKNFKWSFFAGFFNLMASLGYIFGWIGTGNLGGLGISDVDINYSFGDASVSASFDPTFGVYLFCVSEINGSKFYSVKIALDKKTQFSITSMNECGNKLFVLFIVITLIFFIPSFIILSVQITLLTNNQEIYAIAKPLFDLLSFYISYINYLVLFAAISFAYQKN